MLGPTRRQQDPDQRQNDVDAQVRKRLVRPGGNVERQRDEKDGTRQSEDGPAQLHPTPLTRTRDCELSPRASITSASPSGSFIRA